MEKAKEIFSKTVNWVKAHVVPVVSAVVAVILIILIASMIVKTPKKVVKSYIKAFNSGNASKVVKLTDIKAQRVLGYVSKSFDKDDYEEFIEDYEDYDKEINEDDVKDGLEDVFDEIKDNYKSYKISVDEFKSVKKLGKDFYIVKARLSIVAKPKDKDEEKIDETETVYFAVYKNKMATGMSMF